MPLAGLEPARIAPLDFESSASANSATAAFTTSIILSQDGKIRKCFFALTAPKNKYWKFQLPSSDMFAAALFHQGLSCQKSYPHSLDARGPRSKIVDI